MDNIPTQEEAETICRIREEFIKCFKDMHPCRLDLMMVGLSMATTTLLVSQGVDIELFVAELRRLGKIVKEILQGLGK